MTSANQTNSPSQSPSNGRALGAIALATFLTLVPITLLVPGLNELVMGEHGGTRFQAHLFVSLNQLTGIIAVPFAIIQRFYRSGLTEGGIKG